MKYILMVVVFVFIGCSDSNDVVQDLNYTAPVSLESRNSPPIPPSLE